jgi:hypothetical protein
MTDMCLFTSALRASVNKSHIPSLPQNNLYIFGGTLLFRRVVKNRIIEILFYYILIKAHFPLFKIKDSKCSLGLVQQSCWTNPWLKMQEIAFPRFKF